MTPSRAGLHEVNSLGFCRGKRLRVIACWRLCGCKKRYSTNTVRRSLPFALFLLRALLRSAPLLRSYRTRLSGLNWRLSAPRLSVPERVPPLSMNAIKLSKPLIKPPPSKFGCQKPRHTLLDHEYPKVWLIYILNDRISSLFFLDRVARLLPCIPAAFKGKYLHVSFFNQIQCVPGTGSFVLSAAVKDQGFIFGILLRPFFDCPGFFSNRI